MYRSKIYRFLNINQRAYFLNFSANCWLGVRLELIGCLIVFGAALLAVLGRESIINGGSDSSDAVSYIHKLELLSSLAGNGFVV